MIIFLHRHNQPRTPLECLLWGLVHIKTHVPAVKPDGLFKQPHSTHNRRVMMGSHNPITHPPQSLGSTWSTAEYRVVFDDKHMILCSWWLEPIYTWSQRDVKLISNTSSTPPSGFIQPSATLVITAWTRWYALLVQITIESALKAVVMACCGKKWKCMQIGRDFSLAIVFSRFQSSNFKCTLWPLV